MIKNTVLNRFIEVLIGLLGFIIESTYIIIIIIPLVVLFLLGFFGSTIEMLFSPVVYIITGKHHEKIVQEFNERKNTEHSFICNYYMKKLGEYIIAPSMYIERFINKYSIKENE